MLLLKLIFCLFLANESHSKYECRESVTAIVAFNAKFYWLLTIYFIIICVVHR